MQSWCIELISVHNIAYRSTQPKYILQLVSHTAVITLQESISKMSKSPKTILYELLSINMCPDTLEFETKYVSL